MKAITIRPAWAWAIVHGRPVEIRSWATAYRGPIAIHAGSSIKEADADAELIKAQSGLEVPLDLQCGEIVGKARLYACLPIAELLNPDRVFPDLLLGDHDRAHLRKWLTDPTGEPYDGFAWLLDEQQACKGIEVRGQLRLWEVPDRMVQTLDLGFEGVRPCWRAGEVTL